jgi:hypothetical protein
MDRFPSGTQPLGALDSPFPDAGRRSEDIDQEVVSRFRVLVTAHCDGTLHQTMFVSMLLQLEAEFARPHGFIITASNTGDDWTMVALRMRGRSDPCAAFEFLPGSGRVREPKW